jgi:hypothetical protein
MTDLGDGWFWKWNGPDVFTLVNGEHRYTFDAPMTGRKLWWTEHTVYLSDIRDRWDPPRDRDKLTQADKRILAAKARLITGGLFRKLKCLGEPT